MRRVGGRILRDGGGNGWRDGWSLRGCGNSQDGGCGENQDKGAHERSVHAETPRFRVEAGRPVCGAGCALD